MSKMKILLSLSVVVLATSVLAFGRRTDFALTALTSIRQAGYVITSQPLTNHAPSSAATSPQQDQQDDVSTQQQGSEIPERVVYGILFQEVAAFKKKATEKEALNEDASFLREHHKKKLQLDEQQDKKLDKTAADADREVSKLDEKAKKRINDARALYPGGKLREGQAVPLPPAELKTLQRERDEVILRGRDELRRALGDTEFRRVDEILKQDAARKLRPVQPRHTPNSNNTPQGR